MAVFFFYLVKSDLSSVHYCTRVQWTNQFLQGTRKTRPYITGHPVPPGVEHLQGVVHNREEPVGRQDLEVLNQLIFNLLIFD